MPRPQDPCPLRWWENLALFLLAQSPRIERITVLQRVPDTDPPEDEDEKLDTHSPQDYADYLEHLYQRSPGLEPESD